MRASACLLFYGDHEGLARRCLGSVLASLDPGAVADLRAGLSCVSPGTAAYVASALADAPVPAYLVRPDDPALNPGKYPMMRRMFWGPRLPGPAEAVAWFDDDSHLAGAGPGWWAEVLARLEPPHVGAVGKPYRIAPQGRQLDAVRAQPWYSGREPAPGGLFRFLTGGWWAAKYATLHRWDYPFPELRHNGGDVMLGQLLWQLGLSQVEFHDGVAVNDAPRRGLSTPPLWYDYEPGRRPSLAHHGFACGVTPANEAARRVCSSKSSG